MIRNRRIGETASRRFARPRNSASDYAPFCQFARTRAPPRQTARVKYLRERDRVRRGGGRESEREKQAGSALINRDRINGRVDRRVAINLLLPASVLITAAAASC